MFSTLPDLLSVLIGFTLVIVVHEAGHFFAARWAGIRVLAFAVGFGPALCSFRRGMGFRWGSSEPAYLALVESRRTQGKPVSRGMAGDVHPTEYRFNLLPLGGYVKMLGQDDADPSFRSDESDAYQQCVPWKRMIVISAGVVANMISAAVLFVIVFAMGLPTESAKVGFVAPGTPAATTLASNAAALGVSEPGLKNGDVVVLLDGEEPDAFKDITIASAMAAPGASIRLGVQRRGVPETLVFDMEPQRDPVSGMLQLGFGPAISGEIDGRNRNAEVQQQAADELARTGAPGLRPGMRLKQIAGSSPQLPPPPQLQTGGLTLADLDNAVKASGGRPVPVTFTDGKTDLTLELKPQTELQLAAFSDVSGSGSDSVRGGAGAAGDGGVVITSHLLGLTPVMRVMDVVAGKGADRAGIKPGDIFARIGDVEWPSRAEGMAEIRRLKRGAVDVLVWRPAADGQWSTVEVKGVQIDDGKLGFYSQDSCDFAAVLARWPRLKPIAEEALEPPAASSGASPTPKPAAETLATKPSGAELNLPAGAILKAVNGRPVATLGEARQVLQAGAATLPDGSMAVTLDVELPSARGSATQRIDWTITPDERAKLAKLTWVNPIPPSYFATDKVILRGSSPLDSLRLGIRETHKVMLSTYLTFARLFQGTVRVEHLKGPVGIADVGTQLAGRGFEWLIFFLALISVNLAVINFMPFPIVDGGQFLFLVYEHFAGRPVSVRFQNVVTLVGLVMIGSLFLLVTFNDIRGLIMR